MTAQLSRERLEEIRYCTWMDDLGLSMAELNEMARMLLAAMDSDPVAVPDGWKLVPVEPTDEMCDIGKIGVDVCTGLAESEEYYSICGESAARVYRAMLAVSPSSPEKEAK